MAEEIAENKGISSPPRITRRAFDIRTNQLGVLALPGLIVAPLINL